VVVVVSRRGVVAALLAGAAALVALSEWRRTPLTGPLAAAVSVVRDEPPTVPSVDLRAFAGRWYAVATQRTSGYQADCRDRTIAEYTLRGDGSIGVLNACRRLDGRVTGDRVVARSADPATDATLFIRGYFGLRLLPNYFVAGLGPRGAFGAAPGAYGWLIIAGAGGSEAWVMARDPRRARAVLAAAAPAAARAGIALDRLRVEPQPGSDVVAAGFGRERTVAEVLRAGRLTPRASTPYRSARRTI